MAEPTDTASPPKTLHIRGLFQLALVGSAFAGLRLLQSPSTLTFFVFESALAVTLGILLSGRLAPADQPESLPQKVRSAAGEGANHAASRERLGLLATRLGLPSSGDHEDLSASIGKSVGRGSTASRRAWDEGWVADSVISRIAPPAYRYEAARSPAAMTDYLRSLAAEGGDLLSLSQDLHVGSTSYKTMLTKARAASKAGETDRAVRILEEGNHELRKHLRGRISGDLTGFQSRSRRAYLALSTVFVVFVAIALRSLASGLYVPPTEFYVYLAIATAALSLNAQLGGNRRPVGVLVQIMVLAVVLKFYFFYLNPYLYTSDNFFHFLGVEAIANTGHIPASLGHYTYFPGYHVFGLAGASVIGLPRTLFGVFAFLAQIAAIPITYLIGREIASPRVGLFAAILTALSVFFFLATIPLPSLFGFVFMFTAIYALMKMNGPLSGAWFAIFWISALGAFFSHAVSALVLLLALLIRFVHTRLQGQRATATRPTATPVLSYGVVYAGYLAFIALVSFEIFVRSVFAPTQEAALATAPQQTLSITTAYILQSAVAPSGIAIVLFFASFGMFSRSGISPSERRYLVFLGAAFIMIPAIEVATESYRAQSTRLLAYMAIPLVLLGAHGVVSVNRLFRSTRRLGGVLVPVFLVVAFVSSSTYLTTNDERTLFSSIPATPTHITESALASREFLALSTEDVVAYMDFASWLYFNENGMRARNALMMQTGMLDEFDGTGRSFVVVNDHFTPYGNPYAGILLDVLSIERLLGDAQASRIFDAGDVQVYIVP
ncbi:MAG TPA: hypothetical protein VIL58_00070 [Thermoplasmata archaeon]